jgi:hypothetical protein
MAFTSPSRTLSRRSRILAARSDPTLLEKTRYSNFAAEFYL